MLGPDIVVVKKKLSFNGNILMFLEENNKIIGIGLASSG